jgi:hypothetical protein
MEYTYKKNGFPPQIDHTGVFSVLMFLKTLAVPCPPGNAEPIPLHLAFTAPWSIADFTTVVSD